MLSHSLEIHILDWSQVATYCTGRGKKTNVMTWSYLLCERSSWSIMWQILRELFSLASAVPSCSTHQLFGYSMWALLPCVFTANKLLIRGSVCQERVNALSSKYVCQKDTIACSDYRSSHHTSSHFHSVICTQLTCYMTQSTQGLWTGVAATHGWVQLQWAQLFQSQQCQGLQAAAPVLKTRAGSHQMHRQT